MGRLNSSTAANKKFKRKRLIDTENLIARKNVQMTQDTKKKNTACVSKGCLQKLIDDTKKK